MYSTIVRGNLRMRKQNTKTAVPLEVVPERRTERFPPRFRPVGRFCEMRFRNLSSPKGREGEISRPLDHMRQTPFIHSARLINSTNFYSHSCLCRGIPEYVGYVTPFVDCAMHNKVMNYHVQYLLI